MAVSKINVCALAAYVGCETNLLTLPASQKLAAEYRVIPLRLCTENGGKIYIDKVTDIRKTASMKAGGMGLRYTCVATMGEKQKSIYVYKDEDIWFLEEVF
ncbi:hypothetical protein FACS18945_4940 [Bacteroidia bacterium]|nr:hypothetical protein FACS18945_4940 [Bacteroidia bacterium]